LGPSDPEEVGEVSWGATLCFGERPVGGVETLPAIGEQATEGPEGEQPP
jgi:hypothetical protein